MIRLLLVGTVLHFTNAGYTQIQNPQARFGICRGGVVTANRAGSAMVSAASGLPQHTSAAACQNFCDTQSWCMIVAQRGAVCYAYWAGQSAESAATAYQNANSALVPALALVGSNFDASGDMTDPSTWQACGSSLPGTFPLWIKNICTCTGGTAATGAGCTTHRANQCASCNGGYTLNVSTKQCVANTCTCTGGTAMSSCPSNGYHGCASCDIGKTLFFSNRLAVGSMLYDVHRCRANQCTCQNGNGKTDSACGADGAADCATCDDGFEPWIPCTGCGSLCKAIVKKEKSSGLVIYAIFFAIFVAAFYACYGMLAGDSRTKAYEADVKPDLDVKGEIELQDNGDFADLEKQAPVLELSQPREEEMEEKAQE